MNQTSLKISFSAFISAGLWQLQTSFLHSQSELWPRKYHKSQRSETWKLHCFLNFFHIYEEERERIYTMMMQECSPLWGSNRRKPCCEFASPLFLVCWACYQIFLDFRFLDPLLIIMFWVSLWGTLFIPNYSTSLVSRAKTHGLLEVVEIKTQTCTYVQIKGELLPSTYCKTSCCKLPFDSFDKDFGWYVGREGGGDVRNFKFWLENLL